MKIFLTGAAGYIGGSVASGLIKHGHKIVGLVRTNKRASQAEALGIKPIIGSLDSLDLLKDLASDSDAIINTADAEHGDSVMAMLSAIEGSQKPFIHTSGSSVVSDLANGMKSENIFDENSTINPMPGRINRVSINNLVLKSAPRGIRSVVIAPSLIYGHGLGVNPHSIQLPWLINLAKKYGCAQHIGLGENIWSNVHIEDVADLYQLALSDSPPGKFYFAENGETSMRGICIQINQLLNFKKKPKSMKIEEAVAEWGESAAKYTMGSNSRVRGNAARSQLGWAPLRPSLQDFLWSIQDEVNL